MAGVTVVGVLPTHRRQGVLNVDDGAPARRRRDRGEPIAVLTASEASIYGRFGYGVATRIAKVAVDTTGGLPAAAPSRRPAARLRLVTDPAQHSSIAAPVYDAGPAARGSASCPGPTAGGTILQLDREKWRDDASARFCVVHEDDDGTVDGYCWYRVKEDDDDDAVAAAAR